MLLRGAAISLKRKSKESSWWRRNQGLELRFQTGNVDRQLLKAQEIQSASPGGAGYKSRKEEKTDEVAGESGVGIPSLAGLLP